MSELIIIMIISIVIIIVVRVAQVSYRSRSRMGWWVSLL